MANIEAFCVFCEDVREEPGQKQSWLGVLGGSLFTPQDTNKIDDLYAVCIARIENRREVNVLIDVSVKHDSGKVLTPGQYSARFSQQEEDQSDYWVLNLRLDMGGMPVDHGSVASIKFQVDDIISATSLPILWGDPKPAPEPVVIPQDDTFKTESIPPILTRKKVSRKAKADKK
jgi:hypothetical protein